MCTDASDGTADSPDTFYFVTGGSLGSTEILSTSASSPTTVFEGANLEDYEPAYVYFNMHNPGGQKWSVSQDIEQEILRPYNMPRATEDGAATMTVQFQGVTRFHVNPHTASITIKFKQSGDNIVAYVVRAAALKPLDVELGPDLDAMVDNSDPRVESEPLTGDGRYNVSVITMRKPAAAVEYRVHDGASISDTFAGNGAVFVMSEAVNIVNYPSYLPNNSWVVVSENRDLADLDEVEGFYHTGANAGIHAPGLNLTVSGNSGSCQFQRTMSSYIKCVCVDLRQNGSNVEASTGRYRNWHIYYDGRTKWDEPTGTIDPRVVYGVDFLTSGTGRQTYGSYGADDSSSSDGVKNLRLRFKTGGITYAAASTAPYGNDLTFAGSAGTPLVAKTVSSTVFPSNGVVTVAPYADLTLSDHVGNPTWTQYRVMTNGVLRVKGTWRTSNYDAIDLVGGTLSSREGETANDFGTYISYLTLMNGAHVQGKPVRVGHQAVRGNWLVAGDAPSCCESGIEFTAAGVNDVAEGSDFFITGDLSDYGTLQGSSEYWNAHVIKDGAGTMELSGCVTLPNEICVSNVAVRIAEGCTFSVSRKRSMANGDGSEKVAEIWLAGGAFESAVGATNTIGGVVAKIKDAPLNLGDGSKLTLASYSYASGASLRVSDNLGKGATLRIEGLTPGQDVSGIRCGAARLRVRVGANGNLEPYFAGSCLSIR